MAAAMGLRTAIGTTFLVIGLAGCVTRAADVLPTRTSPAEFVTWDCARLAEELDSVQQRAADVAYNVDQQAGNNILALGVGLTIFWPAVLAMRPDGLEATDLARLKGRYEALGIAARQMGCPPPGDELPAARLASLTLAMGEQLVYEDRSGGSSAGASGAVRLSTIRVSALRRGEIEFRSTGSPGPAELAWRQDLSGNIVAAPAGALQWPQLLRGELVLGAVTAGDIQVAGDPLLRARMRGQVVAVGPLTISGRRFDAAVLELFGDAPRGDAYTRVDGVMTVDRVSGVLLDLDLRSAEGSFHRHRRLLRVDPAGR